MADICKCGHEIEAHVAYGCMGRQGARPCECGGFRPLGSADHDPFTTVGHYMADRRGIWTGD